MKEKVAKFLKWKGWYWFALATALFSLWQASTWVGFALVTQRFGEARLPAFLWVIAATILASKLHIWRPAKKINQ